MKRFFAALLAVMLVFSLCVTASAAPADLTGHSYKAYQIFSGTESSVGLTKIVWGSGVDGDALLAALQADSTLGSSFSSCNSAADVAEAMSGWKDDSANAMAFAKLAYANTAGNGTTVVSNNTLLDAGYYLIVDTTTVSGEYDVANLALLKQTESGKVEFASKVDKPVLQKKVKDANDSDAADATSGVWQDSADYDIGDAVPFEITATLGTIADYDTYKVIFTDTIEAGFVVPTAAKNDITVSVDGTDKTDQFTLAFTSDGFTVSCDNVKAAAVGAGNNSVIKVNYTAVLDTDAVVGAVGNWNTASLEYSNDANHSGSGDTGNTGNTPEDQVVVFTYSVTVNKVDEQGEALKGAGFTLYKWDASAGESGDWVQIGVFEAGELESFTWSGIDAGKYKVVESTVPEGYTKMEDQEFVIFAAHSAESDTPALEELTASGLVADTASGAVSFANDGTIEADVTNLKGSLLPETGGIGTKIFYAVGGVLVVAALVLLITKKRMGAEN